MQHRLQRSCVSPSIRSPIFLVQNRPEWLPSAKRYERLSKGRNNAPGAGSSADSPVPSPKKTPTKSSVAKHKTAPKTAASKKAAAKKGKAMKVFAVALAEVLVKQRTDLAKVEEHSSGEDTEIDEAVLGAEGEDSDEDA
ncbi:hypothetical protein AO1008_08144 [Aspergillus oryzae 100-8]|uniref:Uncharacterized protein n=1 Tax=Aspergillus oryzae (strain 3.042) TaxID=1160506 RepID=I8A622_ASPO3|nr:hypothetical protein Ao3042_03429 [Aspergillus oryzae 3.042]KDE81562.1 hypothetical protein AO1008_08144 [Aspergillus oryzae 100-8]|eukprot:EIT80094.1 hypothetical protein Ao3042_03429 [Aspergillus oryzae 3.042]